MTDPQQQPAAASLQPGRRAARGSPAPETAPDHKWIRTVVVAQREPRVGLRRQKPNAVTHLLDQIENFHFRLIRDPDGGVFQESWEDPLFRLQPP